MTQENQRLAKGDRNQSFYITIPIMSIITLGKILGQPLPAWGGTPNGTWLSKPQIQFHSSTNTISQVMRDIKRQNYKLVFLDYRGVPDYVQERVSSKARAENLVPIVWIQSPQYRSLTISQLIYEARHGDAIQVDDHFFANYSKKDFLSLSSQYQKPIFCSIQPFQSNMVSQGRCDQLDVQCYTTQKFQSCIALADKLNAVVSLFYKDTFKYRTQLDRRRFNVFLWPYSEKNWQKRSQNLFGVRNIFNQP
jgi:hypothetical protein